jgi:hypothetical protein
MIPAKQTWHEGWQISTACWDENLPDWEPGDPRQYCASGCADLLIRSVHRGAWLSTARIIAPSNKDMLFTDFNVAHATIEKSLREMIDALKVP